MLVEACARIGRYARVYFTFLQVVCLWLFHFPGRKEQQIEDKAAEVIRFGGRIVTLQHTANICQLKKGGSGRS